MYIHIYRTEHIVLPAANAASMCVCVCVQLLLHCMARLFGKQGSEYLRRTTPTPSDRIALKQ